MSDPQIRRRCISDATARLNQAYRLLGDAADDLRGLGFPDALNEIGRAKDAINRAKDQIGT
jgi:hypothetical protein